jgi:predicted Rossmann-fold nucleotide-binding protein
MRLLPALVLSLTCALGGAATHAAPAASSARPAATRSAPTGKPTRARALRPTRASAKFATPRGAEKPAAVVGHLANPLRYLPAGKPGRIVIGVMGGAGAKNDPAITGIVEAVGEEIARSGNVTLTGAAPGLPDAAVRGARRLGGLTVGISAFASMADHVQAGSPTNFDVLQMTELSPSQRGQRRPNFIGREIDNIERSDAILIVGGRFGTLTELGIALDEQRPVGILLGSGGITDVVEAIIKASAAAGKPAGAPVVYDRDPVALVNRLTKATAEWKKLGISGPLGDHAPIK